MTTARRVAYDLLTAVDDEDSYANLVLPKLLGTARLSSRDAGFATELGYGALRMRGFLDAIIALVSSRPLDRVDAAALRLLELGAYQLLEMNVSSHAAVSETVELAREVGSEFAVGFINAGLRRVSERSRESWVSILAQEYGAEGAIPVLYSHPTWIVDAFDYALRAQSLDTELIDLLSADNAAPSVNLVSLPGVGPEPASLGWPNRFSPLGAVFEGGNPAAVTADAGIRVQDEGSQLAALALSRARPVQVGERWLDVCAGPGGKAAILAAEAIAGGATLVANEVSAHRAELVRAAVRDVSEAVTVTERDGRALLPSEQSFDRILLDAPCTGLGSLRRRPEARWRKTTEQLDELVLLQQELLDAALDVLSPGGVLAYVTCSPVLEETSDQIARVLRDERVSLLDTAAILDVIAREPLDAVVRFDGRTGTAVQLWPHRHGSDAMFVALLSRT